MLFNFIEVNVKNIQKVNVFDRIKANRIKPILTRFPND